MAFQGQDDRSRARPEPGRGSRRRGGASNRSGLSRSPFETLESRVLLSASGPIPNLLSYSVGRGSLPPIVILHLQSHQSVEDAPGGPTALAFDQAVESQVRPLNTVQPDNSAIIEPVSPPTMGVETPVPVMTLSGIPTATSEEVPVAPIDLVRESVSRASSWSGGQPNPGTTAGAQGAVPAFPISGGSSLSGPSVIAGSDGGGVLSGIPDQRRVEIESSIEGSRRCDGRHSHRSGDRVARIQSPCDAGARARGRSDRRWDDARRSGRGSHRPVVPPWNMNPAPPSVRSVNLSFEERTGGRESPGTDLGTVE